MRFVRICHAGSESFGRVLDEETVRLWSGPPWAGGSESDRLVPWHAERLRVPVAPSKIVCVGRNYRAHAAELSNPVPSEPLLFLKPPSALIPDGSAIRLPPASSRVEHEAELAVVVGRTLRDATEPEAREAVFGYTCANDVTARDLQRKDGPWTRAKGFDTFCPVGPWIETELDLAGVRVRATVDGERRQDGAVADMIWSVPALLAYVSTVMTLEPGDLVLTGTPEGVGALRAGGRVEVEVTGIGLLSNTVESR